MERPKVSIVIPVYKGANYLGDAIDSALAQTYENKEIIVVNDGSNDDGATERAALSYGDKIRYFSKENGGVSSALNMGIKNASGEWISWLSHDDLYTDDKVSVQVEDMLNLEKSGVDCSHTMFYCEGGFINADKEKIDKKTQSLAGGLYLGHDMLINMFKGYGIGGCGLLMPKSMFDEVGGFEENMRYMQDVFMWEKAFIAGYNFYVNPRVMSITRIHNMQTSTTGNKYAIIDRETVGKYLEEHLYGIKDSKGNDVLKQYLWFCMRNNSTHIGDMIYKKLSSNGELSIEEKTKIQTTKLYGFFRKKMVKVYYRVRFGTKR